MLNKEEVEKLINTINDVWIDAYPQLEDHVYDIDSLVLRIRNLAEDRKCWAFNTRVLQKHYNNLEAKLDGNEKK